MIDLARQFTRFRRHDPLTARYPYRSRKAEATTRYWPCRCVQDQGQTPACVGFAWGHLLACNPGAGWLDPAGIYRLAQYDDEWAGENYDGTSVLGAARVLHSLGLVREYRWAATVATVRNALLTTGPVVLGVLWTEAMCDPDAQGVITTGGELMGGHAILCDGYDGQRKRFRLLNSWGTSWGKGGRCWVSDMTLGALLQEDGEACVPLRGKFGAFPA